MVQFQSGADLWGVGTRLLHEEGDRQTHKQQAAGLFRLRHVHSLRATMGPSCHRVVHQQHGHTRVERTVLPVQRAVREEACPQLNGAHPQHFPKDGKRGGVFHSVY